MQSAFTRNSVYMNTYFSCNSTKNRCQVRLLKQYVDSSALLLNSGEELRNTTAFFSALFFHQNINCIQINYITHCLLLKINFSRAKIHIIISYHNISYILSSPILSYHTLHIKHIWDNHYSFSYILYSCKSDLQNFFNEIFTMKLG